MRDPLGIIQPSENTSHRHAGGNGAKQTFEVDGLDCAEEVTLLKRELAARPGIHELEFDVINSRMTVKFDDETVSAEQIIDGVASTGLLARVWVPSATATSQTEGRYHWRLVLTVVAGLLVIAGLVSDAIIRGNFWSAFGHGADAAGTSVPLVSRLFYLVSIALGMRFAAPKAWVALRRLRADMNLLMTVAVVGAIILNEWFEAAVVTFLFSIALLLEHWSMGRARRAISALMNLSPPVAHVKCAHESHLHDRRPADVSPGEMIVVRPGERVPLDGVVREGISEVDQSPISGESVPVNKKPGDELFAGTINQTGVLEVEVSRAADDTMLARILHLVSEAQSRRAAAEQWVERFAHYYTPAMIALAVAIAILPPLFASASWSTWAYNALVVLVIACPCALVISTPVSIVSALTSAARHGVLIKGGLYLEAAGSLKAVALDKTGTLTRGELAVQEVVGLSGSTNQDVLRLAAGLEHHSTHPVARAILRHANAEGITPVPVVAHTNLVGLGVQGEIDGEHWWLGNERLMTERVKADVQANDIVTRMEDEGRTVVVLGNRQGVHGAISLADELRAGARSAVDAMRRAGVRQIIMLTGDNRLTAEKIAAQAGVDRTIAELLPEDKVREIERLKAEYSRVAMVGDGINDAPALATSAVGIAMGAIGTDAAIETADVALMSDDLGKVAWLIEQGRATVAIIKQNIAFALGLKLLFIALTLGGLASLWLAIAADTGASLLVIFNGLRLLRR